MGKSEGLPPEMCCVCWGWGEGESENITVFMRGVYVCRGGDV